MNLGCEVSVSGLARLMGPVSLSRALYRAESLYLQSPFLCPQNGVRGNCTLEPCPELSILVGSYRKGPEALPGRPPAGKGPPWLAEPLLSSLGDLIMGGQCEGGSRRRAVGQ